MPYYKTLAIALAVLFTSAQLTAQESHKSPYAGFESRAIKSLSDEDIKELQRGGGWRLALPADLNGVPGPAHLLELKDKLGLSPDQVIAIEGIYAEMQVEAIEIGERLIAAEQAIEAAFVAGQMTDAELRHLIGIASQVRAELRFVHLSRHLLTPPLLSKDQISQYQSLRGYGSDPCDNVPEGHNAAQWRKHNGCG